LVVRLNRTMLLRNEACIAAILAVDDLPVAPEDFYVPLCECPDPCPVSRRYLFVPLEVGSSMLQTHR
jgi:hypothetical protein